MLLHGEGSSAEAWLALAAGAGYSSGMGLVVPRAPATSGPGWPAGSAWWTADLGRYSRKGKTGADLTHMQADGLVRAARGVLATLAAERSSPERPFVLAGFSQGAV